MTILRHHDLSIVFPGDSNPKYPTKKMASFLQNILWSSVEGFVEAGTRSAGEVAGNALIKAGDMIENGGRGVGNSIEKKATHYGSSISGQAYQPSPKALPSTARKPAIKRSSSLPASSKLATSGHKATSSAPLGAKKSPSAAKTATTEGGHRAQSTVGIATRRATKATGGVTGGMAVAGGGTKAPNRAPSGPLSAPTPTKALPKPSPSSPPGTAKTAFKPGAPKPFVPPVEHKKATDSRPQPSYPGPNTLPAHAGTTPVVAARKVKPPPRLGPQVGAGQKMQHISV